MPEHILSGIKSIVALNLRKEGKLQREIADYLDMDRSIVSHYLHGRYPSKKVIEVSEKIVKLPMELSIPIISSLSDNKQLTKKLINSLYNIAIIYKSNACIGCGKCLECPYDAVSTNDNIGISIDHEACVLCGDCIDECPVSAIRFKSTGEPKFELISQDFE
ncbi:4Fe-4S dicluster domain-containing protein [Methanococcus voltae]|uniref:4Fe-4S ferredoxin n=2 Tax=Methanococcus voltae TaxID=2188 RepID=A0A8J7RGH9_METVO|nr:4Fe-4S dicluster domain-containing protein [Methanococcus voltae]MBP2171945.1 4Fe-4S ferredoxin [Methanococcus voltae]MBP2201100.1 4Fe-4S ferredoxin [Methanococcus voltae]MCS3921823.1 4Fe-4S ferredoxin [Methanococcus voltae PS]